MSFLIPSFSILKYLGLLVFNLAEWSSTDHVFRVWFLRYIYFLECDYSFIILENQALSIWNDAKCLKKIPFVFFKEWLCLFVMDVPGVLPCLFTFEKNVLFDNFLSSNFLQILQSFFWEGGINNVLLANCKLKSIILVFKIKEKNKFTE